jgi:hypothetical protein
MFVDLMIHYFMIFISTGAIDCFPECAGLWMFEDADGIDGSPWTLDRVRERLLWFECFDITYVTCD